MPAFAIDTAIIVELIVSIPYFASMVYLIINFTDRIRLKSTKTAYIAGISILYIAAIYNLIIDGYSLQADFTPYIIGVLTFLATVFLINKDSIKRKILILVWLILPTLFIEIFMEIWMYFFVTTDIDSLMADPVSNAYTRMFSSTFTICINICVVLFHHRKKVKKVWLSIIFLSLFPITQAMYLTLILAPQKAQNLNSVLVTNTAFEVIFTIMFFFYVTFITLLNRMYQKEQEQLIISEIKDFNQQYYDMVQNDINNIKYIRHDIGNYIDQLQFLINKGDSKSNEEIKDMLSQLRSNLNEYGTANYCENATANMVLNLASSKAKKADVTLDISAIVPQEINIEMIDLSSCIANLTDNAIRSSAEYNGDSKTADIAISIKNDYLVIKTTNPTNNKNTVTDINELKTTKTDSANHGFGLKIINDIAQKYNGNLSIEIKNGVCTVAVIMQLS